MGGVLFWAFHPDFLAFLWGIIVVVAVIVLTSVGIPTTFVVLPCCLAALLAGLLLCFAIYIRSLYI